MKRNVLIALTCVVVCVAAFSVWRMYEGGGPEPAKPSVQTQSQPLAIPTQPQWFPPGAPAQPGPRVEAPVALPAHESEASAKPPEAAAEANMLTAETLVGTKWKEDKVDIAFLSDGRWQMNGRICAKWEVRGNQVRIFDDKGEEHFLDIVGDSLAFNGKKVGRVVD